MAETVKQNNGSSKESSTGNPAESTAANKAPGVSLPAPVERLVDYDPRTVAETFPRYMDALARKAHFELDHVGSSALALAKLETLKNATAQMSTVSQAKELEYIFNLDSMKEAVRNSFGFSSSRGIHYAVNGDKVEVHRAAAGKDVIFASVPVTAERIKNGSWTEDVWPHAAGAIMQQTVDHYRGHGIDEFLHTGEMPKNADQGLKDDLRKDVNWSFGVSRDADTSLKVVKFSDGSSMLELLNTKKESLGSIMFKPSGLDGGHRFNVQGVHLEREQILRDSGPPAHFSAEQSEPKI